MSYGFIIRSGTGQVVEIASSDEVPGVLVDYFYFDRSQQSTSRSYPAFNGGQLLAFASTATTLGMHDSSISINQATKTVTVTGYWTGFAPSGLKQPVWVTVIGV